MFIHPEIALEVARQRHQDLLAAAERHRIAKASADRKAASRKTRRLETGLVVAAEHSGGGSRDAVEVSHAVTTADHFGHRETDDIVVDLFWSRRGGNEFRVEVEDRRERVRFVLCPTTGEEAIQAFYHPFAVGRPVLSRVA